MTIWQNNPYQLRNTLTTGTVPSPGAAGNTGGLAGRAFDDYFKTTNATVEYNASTGAWVSNNPAGYYSRFAWSGHNSTAGFAIELEFHSVAWPSSGAARILQVFGTGGSVARVELNDINGRFAVYDAAGQVFFSSSGAAAPNNTGGWRVYLAVKPGATITTGEMHFALFTGSDGKSTTAVTGSVFDSTAVNTGTGALTEVQFLKLNTAQQWLSVPFRGIRMNDAGVAQVGPVNNADVSIAAPVATSQASSESATISVSTSATGGSVASSTATALVPIVWADDPGLQPPVASSAASAVVPEVGASAEVFVPVSTSSAGAGPTVVRTGSVIALVSYGYAQAISPVIETGNVLAAPLISVSSNAKAPVVTGNAYARVKKPKGRLNTPTSDARFL